MQSNYPLKNLVTAASKGLTSSKSTPQKHRFTPFWIEAQLRGESRFNGPSIEALLILHRGSIQAPSKAVELGVEKHCNWWSKALQLKVKSTAIEGAIPLQLKRDKKVEIKPFLGLFRSPCEAVFPLAHCVNTYPCFWCRRSLFDAGGVFLVAYADY